jgi:ligand-binding sensor domain-containing protein
MNKRNVLCNALLPVLAVFISCNGQNSAIENVKHTATKEASAKDTKQATDLNKFKANTTTEIGRDVLTIFQDKNYNYWFGTNDGAYCYDGKNLVRFTHKDGLAQDQIQTIQEDNAGNIWFGTGGFGVSRFDGQLFTTFTNDNKLSAIIDSHKDWKTPIIKGTDNLWFYAGGGAYHYDGSSLTYLPFPETEADSKNSSNQIGAYAVYCTLKDSNGNIWFGTQAMGVCCYNGKSFTWFTEKGLSPPAVRALFEDRNGTMWFGNNGAGLFRYDGKTLSNFTEEKGLGNPEFWSELKVSGKPGPGTLARVWTINEDNSGNLWIGTIDAGVWRYDGKNLTNFTTRDGLTTDAVTTIYKDKNGELWFGTNGGGVCKFNGTSFKEFTF